MNNTYIYSINNIVSSRLELALPGVRLLVGAGGGGGGGGVEERTRVAQARFVQV